MSKTLRAFCVGHTPPLFAPPIPYVMLCPTPLGIQDELVIDDNRFGSQIDGSSLAEYSQLFGLYERLLSGDINADELYLFQYRKFVSPFHGGLESASPWVRVLDTNSAASVFPSIEVMLGQTARMSVGSIFNFGESISGNYARVHVVEDLVMFVAACSESGKLSQADINTFATLQGIIPSPSVCLIQTDLFIKVMEILVKVWNCYYPHYHIQRSGYQRRVGGYLFERLHSFLLCKWLLDGSESNMNIWQRYVISNDIP